MEERPSDRPHEKRYHHGGERSPSRTKTSLKNDPSQCQHQETQTKKAGNGKINGSVTEREKTPSASDSVGIPYPANGNGHRSQLDSNWKLKQSGKAHPTLSKTGSRGGHGYRNSMDSRNDRTPDLRAYEGKKEPGTLPNGVVPLSSGLFTNGYPSKPSPDNDGSGSESGYATPKKRKSPRSGAKGVEPVTQPLQETTTNPLKQEPEPPIPEQTEKPAATKVEAPASAARAKHAPVSTVAPNPTAAPLPSCEPQRKNSDSKATGSSFSKKHEDRPSKAKSNASSKEKEDSWTLFKPPPVFPVDNSSAKIVPKISYASKVKENLNKAAQAAGEVPAAPSPQSAPSQAPGRPSQVPMSAMKTITSSSFANGPLSGEGNGCSLSGPLFASASTVALDNVAPGMEEGSGLTNSAPSSSSSSSSSSSATPSVSVTGEPRKHGLFVYPLAPSSSNMQPALPSGRQTDPPAPTPAPAPTNQKALGDIFQNQWGLSFINDPSTGPEGGGAVPRHPSGKGKAPEVTFQGDCPTPLPTHGVLEATPSLKAPELEKRTSPQPHSSVLKLGPPPPPALTRDGTAQTQPSGPTDGQTDTEARSLSAIVFASPKEPPSVVVEALRASPTNGASSPLPRGPSHSKGLDRRCSWGSFDLKAAVNYHTKEMESILNLQKQDPKRVVVYGETKDGPNQ
ncbi:hypothetical protein AGOR_G00123450 [Albula goreensis]|uniref:Nuclear fragile X mental retardation-interacting protein 2 n=1 Tax=Albula goreensis TaxID=1534307 RepID=A0A8T3D9H0_9TELE|nr:hypothetical protein AGOR_G00123450 [Albula goreensis]